MDVVIDVWDLRAGHDKYAFMERCVNDPSITKVLMLCDRTYAEKADGRMGGVGDETSVITPQVYRSASQERFIPVVMERSEQGEAYLPAYLGSRMYVDLSDRRTDEGFEDLLCEILGIRKWRKPELGRVPDGLARDSSLSHADGGEVRVREVAKDSSAGGETLVGLAAARKAFADYSWAELKAIADEIAAAGEGEWLGVAKRYGLVGSDGRLGGDMKPVEVSGTTRHVRILGFRHDDRVDGRGKAGISFEFADVPVTQPMNHEPSNKGGWEASELRGWLNGVFLDLLPQDLATHIVRVGKRTNNRGEIEVGGAGDTSVVTVTEDRLWPPSLSEVYGGRVTHPGGNDIYSLATYCAEGTQYQLYSDKGVSATSYGFCKKDGANSSWWLRSLYAEGAVDFHFVTSTGGSCRSVSAVYVWGVSPGFCF